MADELWRKAFRASAPLLGVAGLEALASALERDDPTLLQGQTTSPPPLMCVRDWPIEGACAFCYAGWKGDGLENVGEADEFFGRACFEACAALGEPAGVRWFLNWYDETPRDEMRRELLPEVRLAIARAKGGVQ